MYSKLKAFIIGLQLITFVHDSVKNIRNLDENEDKKSIISLFSNPFYFFFHEIVGTAIGLLCHFIAEI